MRRFLFLLLSGAAVYAGTESSGTIAQVLKSVNVAMSSAWEFCGAVGEIVTQVGEAAPNLLGFLTCLILPLAGFGAWMLPQLPRFWGMMTLRDNVRSFFHD